MIYEIVVSNAGPSDARSVIVTDSLSADVTFNGASDGCVLSGGNVVCTVGTLAAGSSRSFLIAVNANQSTLDGDILTNSVIATTATTDPTPVNTDSVTTTVAGFGNAADMGVVKSTAQGTVVAGELITYSLSVTNSGPSAATNVRLLDLIPAGTTVVSMTAVNADFVGEYCSLGGSCFLGTVYTNTTATVALVLRVNQDFTGTSLGNSAAVSADQQDPDSSDNISSVSTPVTTSADLSVAKSDLPDPVIVGSTLLYQIVVTNSGPSTARSVLITDTLDANVAYVGGTPGCSVSGNRSSAPWATSPPARPAPC